MCLNVLTNFYLNATALVFDLLDLFYFKYEVSGKLRFFEFGLSSNLQFCAFFMTALKILLIESLNLVRDVLIIVT